MKKSLKYFSILIMILLVLTGCSEKKKEEKTTDEEAQKMLEAAITKMNDVENFAMNVDATIGMSFEGSTISMDMKASYEYDDEGNEYGLMSMSFLGYEEIQESYAITKDGYLYTYMNDGEDNWYYIKEETPTEPTDEEENEQMLDMFKEIKIEDSDREGYTKIVVTVDATKMTDIYEQEETDIILENDLVMNVYLKDGYISIIEFDASEIMNQLLSEEDFGMNMEVSAPMTIEITKIGQVEPIVVPNSILDSAKSYEDYMKDYEDEYYNEAVEV